MNPIRKAVAGAAMVAAALGGGAIGASLITAAHADTASTSTTAPPGQSSQTAPQQAPPRFDPSTGGHAANGVTEELLTGDTAAKVKAAALAAVQGGTIQRVETDAEGATYEAHMLDANGNPVTVELDASFEVTSTESGPGCPDGHRGPPPQGQTQTPSQGSTTLQG